MLKRTKIQDLPTDTIFQLVEALRYALVTVKFLISSVTFFLMCYPGEWFEGPISTTASITVMLIQQ